MPERRTMSNASLHAAAPPMAAPRRLALRASRLLERWATEPAAPQRRAARTAERALADREQHALRALATLPLR